MLILSVPENILLFLCGFGLLQGFLLAAVLYFHPRADRSVSTFLALYIACVSVPILIPLGQHLFSWQTIIFIDPVIIFIGPLLYFYVRSFRETITWRKAWPHLIIFIPYALLAWWSYVNVGLKYPRTIHVPPEVAHHPSSYIPVTVRFVQRLVYYFLTRRELNTHQRSIRNLFSDISRINLNWVRWLNNSILIILFAIIILYIMILRYPEHIGLWLLICGCMVTIYIYLAAWRGVSQPTIWQVQPGIDKAAVETLIAEAEPTPAPVIPTRPRRAGLSEAKINDITTRIITLMEADKVYQNPELTLQQLASTLQLSVHNLSQAINDGLQKSFYDLVNGYRVEEAKRLLINDKDINYTILAIGFGAGFNSKTTFNTVFKKFTGLTPSDYRHLKNKAALITN